MTLGEKIKACRQDAGMSQEKVAEFLGVSRQAVTKWEANLSAPNTENLFKLAEVFGTTVDFLLASPEAGRSPAGQICELCKMEEERRAEKRRGRLKENLLFTSAVIGGYILIYLAGRMFATAGQPASVLGWLWGNDPGQLRYLYAWLLRRNISGPLRRYPQSPHCLEKSIFPVPRFSDLQSPCFLGNCADGIRRVRHTGVAITAGLFGAASLCSLLQWAASLKKSPEESLI